MKRRISTHMAKLYALFAILALFINAVHPASLQASHLVQRLPSRIENRDLVGPLDTRSSAGFTTSIDSYVSSSHELVPRQNNFMRLWNGLRIGTCALVWNFYRLDALTNPDPKPPDKFIRGLKKMYTDIRNSAINEWAKLPEQSYVRIVSGNLLFTILPPADRTVPWTFVEELTYTLALLVSAGLGGLITGIYTPMATSVVFYYYLQVIAPIPEGQAKDVYGPSTPPVPGKYPTRPPARRPGRAGG